MALLAEPGDVQCVCCTRGPEWNACEDHDVFGRLALPVVLDDSCDAFEHFRDARDVTRMDAVSAPKQQVS